MAINRYSGSNGRFERVPEPGDMPPQQYITPKPPQPAYSGCGGDQLMQGIGGALSRLMNLETEDLILLLIIYLMYRESGDKQLLLIMAILALS